MVLLFLSQCLSPEGCKKKKNQLLVFLGQGVAGCLAFQVVPELQAKELGPPVSCPSGSQP